MSDAIKDALRTASIAGRGKSAAIYHHLIEADRCYRNELYIASCLCSITFIDISARYLKVLINAETTGVQEALNPNDYLKRNLMVFLMDSGVDVSSLAIEGEDEFNRRIQSETKFELRRIRDNICHGDLSDYFEEYEESKIFVPEMMKPQAEQLIDASQKWLTEFGRKARELGY